MNIKKTNTSKCSKCGQLHPNAGTRAVSYSSVYNVLIRTCERCGFSWPEKCLDGSEPTLKNTSKSKEFRMKRGVWEEKREPTLEELLNEKTDRFTPEYF